MTADKKAPKLEVNFKVEQSSILEIIKDIRDSVYDSMQEAENIAYDLGDKLIAICYRTEEHDPDEHHDTIQKLYDIAADAIAKFTTMSNYMRIITDNGTRCIALRYITETTYNLNTIFTIADKFDF